LLFPIITLEILVKNDELVFCKPLFKDSFFCFVKSLEKIDFLIFTIGFFVLICFFSLLIDFSSTTGLFETSGLTLENGFSLRT
jgi:hypothetical protein